VKNLLYQDLENGSGLGDKPLRFWTAAGSLACLPLMALALWFWGAREVRGNPVEVFFLSFIGMTWVHLARLFLPWLGLDTYSDVRGRKNSAVMMITWAASLSITMLYIGGSLGEGPSYVENVFSVGLATVVWFGLWIVFENVTHVSFCIAEERDLASSLRFGGLLLAWALILGRAVAGDWHSVSGTVADAARDGWPALVLGGLACLPEKRLQPTRQQLAPSWFFCGLLPALGYLGVAVLWFWHLGKWEGMPR